MMNTPLTDWQARRVWIVGASSGIGAALAEALAARGARIALSARRVAPLEALAARAAPGQVQVLPLDVTDAAGWKAAADRLQHSWGGIDLVIFMAASFSAMRAWELDTEAAEAMIATNLSGVVSGLAAVIPMLEQQRRGGIALVASVAGYGALPKGLIYGTTKAALIHLAEGLYLDLAPRDIAVYLINPGFVRTPLTAANDFPMPALMEPEQAAAAIIRGIERGRFEIRFPRRLAWPLRLLRLLPYRWYFPLVHRGTGL
jgi:NAD(P)-dependent dehydrogenase (short-subunit alcohol dehydrogenase family)